MTAYIPYYLRVKLQQIEPALDIDWKKNLDNLLKEIPESLIEKAEDQFLKRKNIRFDPQKKEYYYIGYTSTRDLAEHIKNPKLLNLIPRLLISLDYLKNLSTALEIANYLESVLSEIREATNSIHTKDIEKKELLCSFLYDAADIIKKIDFSVKENTRGITTDQVREFILEVFIKKIILRSWFSKILQNELKSDKNPFFNDYLYSQQKIRDFDLIKTSKYYFIIASTIENTEVHYSIRAFLSEETLGSNGGIYIQGLVLEESKISDPSYIKNLDFLINRIIGIQRTLSPHITQLIEGFHDYNQTEIFSLLSSQLNVNSFSVDSIVNEHLIEVEKKLTVNILEPFQAALNQVYQQPDELEYCFLNIRRLFIELLNMYDDFLYNSAIAYNNQALNFKQKLLAYLKLLNQRKSQIFKPFDSIESYEPKLHETNMLLVKMQNLIKSSLEENRKVQQQISLWEKETKKAEQAGFFTRLFKKTDGIQKEIEKLQKQQKDIRSKCYSEIISIRKQNPTLCVNFEIENAYSSSYRDLNYAIATGTLGVSRLPLLITLPNDPQDFNLQLMSKNLYSDVIESGTKWTIK
ncbi:hypothetical protein [Acinetobacter sp.]|uniref:hypothetical protein n=1 Tax=Acinetobacter sp. TaxID=472 RepID=UPI0035B2671D